MSVLCYLLHAHKFNTLLFCQLLIAELLDGRISLLCDLHCFHMRTIERWTRLCEHFMQSVSSPLQLAELTKNCVSAVSSTVYRSSWYIVCFSRSGPAHTSSTSNCQRPRNELIVQRLIETQPTNRCVIIVWTRARARGAHVSTIRWTVRHLPLENDRWTPAFASIIYNLLKRKIGQSCLR